MELLPTPPRQENNRHQVLSKGSCAKTTKYSCISHPIRQDHNMEKGVNAAPKHASATATSPPPACWTDVALWETFQILLDDQRDRKKRGVISSLPLLQSLTLPHALTQITKRQLTGFKNSRPQPVPQVSSRPTRSSQGSLEDVTPENFYLGWRIPTFFRSSLPILQRKRTCR